MKDLERQFSPVLLKSVLIMAIDVFLLIMTKYSSDVQLGSKKTSSSSTQNTQQNKKLSIFLRVLDFLVLTLIISYDRERYVSHSIFPLSPFISF